MRMTVRGQEPLQAAVPTCWRAAVLLITPTTELLRRRNRLLKNRSARSSLGPAAPLSFRSAEWS